MSHSGVFYIFERRWRAPKLRGSRSNLLPYPLLDGPGPGYVDYLQVRTDAARRPTTVGTPSR